jgi:hypothetical protein
MLCEEVDHLLAVASGRGLALPAAAGDAGPLRLRKEEVAEAADVAARERGERRRKTLGTVAHSPEDTTYAAREPGTLSASFREYAGRVSAVVTSATLTCPECGAASREEMPTDACQYFWTCPSCGARLRPLPGDCCVFCSYADHVCPPRQAGDRGCG